MEHNFHSLLLCTDYSWKEWPCTHCTMVNNDDEPRIVFLRKKINNFRFLHFCHWAEKYIWANNNNYTFFVKKISSCSVHHNVSLVVLRCSVTFANNNVFWNLVNFIDTPAQTRVIQCKKEEQKKTESLVPTFFLVFLLSWWWWNEKGSKWVVVVNDQVKIITYSSAQLT